MRVPCPDGIETFRLKIERSLQGRGIMKSKVGSEPVDYSGLNHVAYHEANGIYERKTDSKATFTEYSTMHQ